MKIIPLGLQCSIPEAIKQLNIREYSYPLDWIWSPSQTTYNILQILLNNGIDECINYMTTGFTYYKYMNNEHYISINEVSNCQMNKNTGLGITHFTINDDYKITLKKRLTRLLVDIKSLEDVIFIYADAANPYLNYHLDEIEYGKDATEYLLKIHDLIYPINKNIQIIYFCWNERLSENNIIKYIPFDYKNNWFEVTTIIKKYLLDFILKYITIE